MPCRLGMNTSGAQRSPVCCTPSLAPCTPIYLPKGRRGRRMPHGEGRTLSHFLSSLTSFQGLKSPVGRCLFEDRGGVRQRKPSFPSQIKWESRNGVYRSSRQGPALPGPGQAGPRQQLRGQPSARPGDEVLLSPQVPRTMTALPFVCLAPLCSPSSQALLSCQVGFLPPPQLFLYIWSQQGELERPHGGRGDGACSCVPGFLGKELQP